MIAMVLYGLVVCACVAVFVITFCLTMAVLFGNESGERDD